jgi:tetratricopeptide (TPR) repeat protein
VQPAPAGGDEADGKIVPANVSTLVPVYRKAVEQGAPRAESNLGLFLLQIGKSAEAEAPLRRAIALDERNHDPGIDAGREGLALSLEGQGKRDEAIEVFRRAAAGLDPRVAARASVRLAELDPERAEEYYRKAAAAEEKGSGSASPRLAVVLYGHARELRARARDREAEPVAACVAILQAAPKSDPRATIDVLNALGNLVEGRRQLTKPRNRTRAARRWLKVRAGERNFAVSCTYLADVCGTRKAFAKPACCSAAPLPSMPSLWAGPAGNRGRHCESGDGDDRGRTIEAGAALLRQALAIYENTFDGQRRSSVVRGQLANNMSKHIGRRRS